MKPPREVLLARHRAAEPKLDALRRKLVAHLPALSAEASLQTTEAPPHRVSFRELFLPLRWHLAGMSAVWAVIALLNVDPSAPPAAQATKQHGPLPRQLLTALRENRRQIAELLESAGQASEPAPEPPVFLPKRRGQLPSTNAMT